MSEAKRHRRQLERLQKRLEDETAKRYQAEGRAHWLQVDLDHLQINHDLLARALVRDVKGTL